MRCPLCAALHREHSLECEIEASATVKQRAELMSSQRGDASIQDSLDQEVLRSRKRQAHIAFELHRHQTLKHPLAIAKAAS